MNKLRLFFLFLVFSITVIISLPSFSFDNSKLIGTWSYEKTETNFSGRPKPVSMKVFNTWFMTFNNDNTYSEETKIQPNANVKTVKGKYIVLGDVIERSENKVRMKILVLNDRELVTTSVNNSKIYFKRK
jgi:hypothetical protein